MFPRDRERERETCGSQRPFFLNQGPRSSLDAPSSLMIDQVLHNRNCGKVRFLREVIDINRSLRSEGWLYPGRPTLTGRLARKPTQTWVTGDVMLDGERGMA